MKEHDIFEAAAALPAAERPACPSPLNAGDTREEALMVSQFFECAVER